MREHVRVVFVTVDPERDTPERLKEWLSSFDSSFVGLRGTDEQVADALAFYRYPPPERSGEEEGYTVGHPALVYAFTPDDRGGRMYGVETTRAIWVHDLNLMARHDVARQRRPRPSATSAAGPPARRPAGDVRVLDAYVPRPADRRRGRRVPDAAQHGRHARHPGGARLRRVGARAPSTRWCSRRHRRRCGPMAACSRCRRGTPCAWRPGGSTGCWRG